jgi:hypothetical protein
MNKRKTIMKKTKTTERRKIMAREAIGSGDYEEEEGRQEKQDDNDNKAQTGSRRQTRSKAIQKTESGSTRKAGKDKENRKTTNQKSKAKGGTRMANEE